MKSSLPWSNTVASRAARHHTLQLLDHADLLRRPLPLRNGHQPSCDLLEKAFQLVRLRVDVDFLALLLCLVDTIRYMLMQYVTIVSAPLRCTYGI